MFEVRTTFAVAVTLILSLSASGTLGQESPLICINSGGNGYTAPDGTLYTSDQYYSGGRSSRVNTAIADTDHDPVYQRERYGNFDYEIPVPSAGFYTVELNFAEIYFQVLNFNVGVGARVFDVRAEGSLILDDYDILANTAPAAAITETSNVLVQDGTLSLSFEVETEWPKISSICVYSSAGDSDGDGVNDSEDAFPNDASEQFDTDGDGVGDNADVFPNNSSDWADLDGDGIGDNADADRDGDGVDNAADAFPDDATEWADNDGDGLGNNSDPTPDGPDPDLIMCVNSGGGDFMSTSGVLYQADQHYSSGSVSSYVTEIANTLDDEVYQTERYGPLSYSVPVSQPGTYRVELLFAEIYFQALSSSGGPGSRVFDVFLEGELKYDNFDILAQTGSATALQTTDLVNVVDGNLDISFGLESDWPKISGFCVYSSEGDIDGDGVPDSEDEFPNDPNESVDSDGDGVGDNGDAFPNNSNEAYDTDGDGTGNNSDPDIDNDGFANGADAFPLDPTEWLDSDGDGTGDNSDITPFGPVSYPNLVMCINSGGGAHTDVNGVEFLPDTHYIGGQSFSVGFDIAGTVDDPIFQTERSRQFSYAIPVPGTGNYRLELFMAETYFQAASSQGGPGSRVFDIYAEGGQIFNDYDILTKVPAATALVEKVPVNVTDGTLDLTFGVISDWPKIAGLCVYGNDGDQDADGVLDGDDEFPNDFYESQDTDGDGVGDNADMFPTDPTRTLDTDGDGIADELDPDVDNDGFANAVDAFPYDASEWLDTDGDGIGDNSDPFPEGVDLDPDLLFCINSAGPAMVGADGIEYLADTYHVGGQTGTRVFEIEDTLDDQLYHSERFGIFSYQVPVTEERFYRVELLFAETYFQAASDQGGPGTRRFDVYVEDKLAIQDFDILAAVPTLTAIKKNVITYVTDGVIDIDFGLVTDWPKVSGMCLYNSEPDSDFDGVLDSQDEFPNDPTETVDTDGDGVGDNSDVFPGDDSEWSDIDGDGIGDNSDLDRDGDGVNNELDDLPDNPDETVDSDGDGWGDNFDAYPNDPTRSHYSDPYQAVFVQSGSALNTFNQAKALIANKDNEPNVVELTTEAINYAEADDYYDLTLGNSTFPYQNNFAAYFTRDFYVAEDGYYSFLTRSDDGVSVEVNGVVVVNDPMKHLPTDTRGSLFLTEGLHTVEVYYFEATGGAMVEVLAAKGNSDDFYAGAEQYALLTDRINAELVPPPTLAPHIGGTWGGAIDWPHIPVSAANLPDGRILTWLGGSALAFDGGLTKSSVYDPIDGSFVMTDHPIHNQFCAGIAMREDGTVLTSGGNPATTQTGSFNYRDDMWHVLPDMNMPRWYPTAMTLPDNRVFTTFALGAGNTSEVYSDNNGWLLTTGATMQPLQDEQNHVNAMPHGNGSTDMQWYAFMHVAPNGKVFHSGPTFTMHWFETDGLGSVEAAGVRKEGDQARMFGSAVMYDIGKVLVTGGNDQSKAIASSDQAFSIDINGAAPVVTELPNMLARRTFQNSVVLPTGKVLVVGGTTAAKLFDDDGTILQPELWDPDTNTWTHLSSHTIPRNYHSVALLMKDGRVFSGGGGACGNCSANHKDAQIYTPSYFYNADGSLADRPSINSGPEQASAGEAVVLDASAGIAEFNMIRLSGTTHSINTDQRFIPVSFSAGSGSSYTLDMNDNSNVLIPGFYWIFAVDAQGVPSEGFTIQIVRDAQQSDSDGDGVVDAEDDFPNDPTRTKDTDGDGIDDQDDAFPNDPSEWGDIDGDGIGDNTDNDRDGDGVLNAEDAFPNDPTESADSDGDGLGDNADPYPNNPDLPQDDLGNWEILEPALGAPQARHENDYILVGDKMFLLGGRGDRGVNEYDPVNNTWKNWGSPRDEEDNTRLDFHHFQAVVWGDRVYIIGAMIGYYPKEQGVAEIYSFDPADPAKWRVEGYVPEERQRGSTAAVNYKGKIYIIGGNTLGHQDGAVPWFDSFDPATGEWTVLPDAPHARDHHRAAIKGDKLYVVAGRRSATNLLVPELNNPFGDTEDTIDVYDFEAAGGASWSSLDKKLPTPRSGIALFSLGSELIVAAGESEVDEHEQVESYDVLTDSWRVFPDLNFARNAPGGASFGNTLFVVAGNNTNAVEINSQEVLEFVPRPFPADTDVDGVPDSVDEFPSDSSEYVDSDGDGVGDNKDAFPNDATETADTDGDGVGDNADAYPNDPALVVNPAAPAFNSTTITVDNIDRVWNVNPDNDTASVVEFPSGNVAAEVQVGDRPWSVAVSPTSGLIYVSNKGSATISVINPVNKTVIDTINLAAGSEPHGLVVAPNGQFVYVAQEALSRVIKINTSDKSVAGTAELSGKPRHLALSADGSKLYVSNFVTPPVDDESTAVPKYQTAGGEVFVVNAGSMASLNTITLGYSNRGVSESAGPGLPNYLNAPVISPDGTTAYVPSKQDNIMSGGLRGGPGMTFDQTVRAVASVINLGNETSNTGARIQLDNASVATGAVFSGNGQYLFVALETAREIEVHDVQNGFRLTRISVGRAPQGLAISSNGETLFVHNYMDRSITAISIRDLLLTGGIGGFTSQSIAVVGNEALSAQLLNGKQLFYDAADDRLALDNYMSCASCHNDGGDDGRVWDLTGMGEGVRNTINLKGHGAGHGRLHWSANFDEVQDFENQIRSLAGGTGLMSNADFTATTATLGPAKAGLSADLDALAAYVNSLTDVPASPDRNGGLSADAQLGKQHFQDEGCASCHSGVQMTDSPSNALHNVGTIDSASGQRLGGPLTGFDTPGLHGLWDSAPYLHDGSAMTILDAILAHDDVDSAKAALIEKFLLEAQPADLN